MARNPIQHAFTKCINTDYHFVRDIVLEKAFEIEYWRNNDQVVDMLT